MVQILAFTTTAEAGAKRKKIVHIALTPEAKKQAPKVKATSRAPRIVASNDDFEIEPLTETQKISQLGLKKSNRKTMIAKNKKSKKISRGIASIGKGSTNRIGMAMPEKVVQPEIVPVARYEIQSMLKDMKSDDQMDLAGEDF